MGQTKQVEKKPTSLTELAALLLWIDEHLNNVFASSELIRARGKLSRALAYIRDRKETDYGLDELYARVEHKYGGRVTVEVNRLCINRYQIRVISWRPPVQTPIAAIGSTVGSAVEGIEDQLDARER